MPPAKTDPNKDKDGKNKNDGSSPRGEGPDGRGEDGELSFVVYNIYRRFGRYVCGWKVKQVRAILYCSNWFCIFREAIFAGRPAEHRGYTVCTFRHLDD